MAKSGTLLDSSNRSPGSTTGNTGSRLPGLARFFEGCIAKEWAGAQHAHFLWLGRRNTGKRWATSMVVKLWEIAWDLWDHRNQIKHNIETDQDVAHSEAILHSVRAEYAFGCTGLPHRDWHLFQCPLLSLLTSSLYYQDVWLIRVQTARTRQNRWATKANDPTVTTAEEDLPNMAGPRQIFNHFLASISRS
jgi:hypothetical protein